MHVEMVYHEHNETDVYLILVQKHAKPHTHTHTQP